MQTVGNPLLWAGFLVLILFFLALDLGVFHRKDEVVKAKEALAAYPNLREIIWVQEEPRNMGAWRYMAPRLRTLAGADLPVAYIGRQRRASPAEGSSDAHAAEQARIVHDAFVGLPEPPLVEEHGVQHAG